MHDVSITKDYYVIQFISLVTVPSTAAVTVCHTTFRISIQ